jgi:hypothetical protein
MAIAEQLEALKRRLDVAGVPDPTIEEREQRAAAQAEAAAAYDTVARRRDVIAAAYVAQLEKVETALAAFVAANDELEAIAAADDDVYHELWQRLVTGRPADPRGLVALDLPALPMSLGQQLRRIRAQAEGVGVLERAARAAR